MVNTEGLVIAPQLGARCAVPSDEARGPLDQGRYATDLSRMRTIVSSAKHSGNPGYVTFIMVVAGKCSWGSASADSMGRMSRARTAVMNGPRRCATLFA